jgi:hypothetical protein
MSSLTPAQFSFLYQQEWIIQFGLLNVFYGGYNDNYDSLFHMRLMHVSLGVYMILVIFLVYFFCECLLMPNQSMPMKFH